jgi:hypothetical protein
VVGLWLFARIAINQSKSISHMAPVSISHVKASKYAFNGLVALHWLVDLSGTSGRWLVSQGTVYKIF